MQNTLFMAHSGLRYLVLLAAVVAIIAAVLGLRSATTSKAERIAGSVFAGVLDLQVLLGIILLSVWRFYGQLMGHITMMVVAAAAVHVAGVMARRREPQGAGSRIRLIGYGIGLIAIIGGIMAIQRPIL